MRRVAAFLLGAAVLGSTAVAASPPPPRTATAVCSTRAFTVAFDPKRQATVTDGERVLASASFTTAKVSGRCRRVGEPRAFVSRGLGREIRARTAFRCAATKPIRIHVNPIRDGDTGGVAGSALVVGVGSPRLRVIVSAVLKNKGDPKASRVYRAAANCKPGA
jgi:hypothetical protein